MNPYEFVDQQQAAFVEELKDWLRIPSISTDSAHKADVRRAAEWLRDHFNQIGISQVEIIETPGHPLVYAEWLGAGPDAPTVLIYGHYDVQPADDGENHWLSEPFEPVERDGNLYARGATDDKGQTFTQIKAMQALLQDSMPVNVKFLVEGEEEKGSANLYPYVEANAQKLAADVVVISDSGILALDKPSIVVGLRGIFGMEIEIKGPRSDLHSGMYGGVVQNPLQALAQILAQMHDAEGRITIPGFYDDVRPLSDEERAALAQSPFTRERFERETGAPQPWGEPEFDLHERIGVRPTFEINGLIGGYTGEGGKTVLPASALAKITCRLVPDQDPQRMFELVRDYVKQITPPGVTSEVRQKQAGGWWAVIDPTSPHIQAAARAYEFGFGAPPVYQREGGSIPIVGTFQKTLGAPVVMMGFGLPDDNLHGPNEKYSLASFERGMKTAIKFYQDIAAL